MPVVVQFLIRAPSNFRSIEELFGTIGMAFPDWIQCMKSRAPRGGACLGAIIENLFWARSLRNCDVIHQTGDIHYAVLGVWRCPVVLTIHDLRFLEESCGLKRLLFWWLWLYLPCLRADKVTVISEFTKNRLLALGRVRASKVRVIPNCVAPEFVPQSKPWPTGIVRLLQIGTTENKNLARVGEACSGVPVQLSILGKLTDSQRVELERQGVDYECHSDLTKEKVVALYAASDLVVFVSTYEGFGMPILEAQAVGRPVLTSNIAPMNDVAGEGALKVDPFSVESIRNGLTQLLNDAVLRDELVQKGFENVAGYSAVVVAARYAAIYKEVMEAR